MADETTDTSNREQVVICIRWVDESLEVHEDFIGLHQVDMIDAKTLTAVIIDVLLRMNLSIRKCRGQCYDGAAAMSGPIKGVAANIKKDEPRSLYTHCYGHALNLACADSIKKCKLISDALDTTREITKLIKKSPKRDAQLLKIQQIMSDEDTTRPGIRLLCPTRWTVRAEAMHSIIMNYDVLMELWEWSLKNCSDTDMKARIRGVSAHMERFDFFFGLCLGQCILQHADTLSQTLQKKDISAAEGQEVAGLTVTTLKTLRTSENFQMFWDTTKSKADSCKVDKPCLPRRKRAPARYEIGDGHPDFHDAHYRQIYFEVLDLMTARIEDRFNQADYKIYVSCEQLLLKAAIDVDYTTEMENATSFYGDDFQPARLEAHLKTFTANYPK